MSAVSPLGYVNGHIIGRVLKEAVRRATVIIRDERTHFVAQGKIGYGGTMDDVFTSADTKAQEVYLRTFNECFPVCGVVAEENNLTIAGDYRSAPDCLFEDTPDDMSVDIPKRRYSRHEWHPFLVLTGVIISQKNKLAILCAFAEVVK
jgi:hypothetical protein